MRGVQRSHLKWEKKFNVILILIVVDVDYSHVTRIISQAMRKILTAPCDQRKKLIEPSVN